MRNKNQTIGICGIRINEQNIMPFINLLKKECEKKEMHLINFSFTTDNQEAKDEIAGQYELINLIPYINICALIILSETIKNADIIQRLC